MNKLTFVLSVALASASVSAGEDLARWVNPRIGASANGHTTAAAAFPFGLLQAGPDTGNFAWDYCSGYRDADRALYGFSQTHLNGTGCLDLGDLLILPYVGARPADEAKVPFLKETEIAEPGFYAVTLADGTRCEVAVAPHAAIYRFAFAKDGAYGLKVDPAWGLVGSRAQFDKRVLDRKIADDGLSGTVRVKGWVSRSFSFVIDKKTDGKVMTVRLALSANSVDAARRNLAAETDGKTLEDLKSASRAAWNELFSRMTVCGADDGGKTSFYTSLYHLFVQPNNLADVGEKPFYSTFSTWDTFRAAHPLYTLIASDKVPGFVDSMLVQGRRTGYLPIWTLWGEDNQCMIGTHSIPVIVDWFLKGKATPRRLNKDGELSMTGGEGSAPPLAYWEAAYAQIKKTLTKRHDGRLKERWDLYDRYGYYPYDEIAGESVSRTMECAYDDACAARMAAALGKTEDAAFFAKRAANWKNVFDPSLGLVRGKDSKGRWREPFNPFALGHGADTANDFTEGNAWQYTWHVMQDPEGLVAALGGKDPFFAKLNTLFCLPETVEGQGFTADVSGLIGQYAHGNEPSHHTVYFFQYADRGWRTAELVREIFDKFYLPAVDGLCGNDDCGQMSAWYLFSAAGIYPFDPCGGDYDLGAPQFPKITMKLGDKTLTVLAKNLSKENKYVKSVTFNGQPVTGFKLRHADLVKGGELVFEMIDRHK